MLVHHRRPGVSPRVRERLGSVRHREDEEQRERAQQDVAEPRVECHAPMVRAAA